MRPLARCCLVLALLCAALACGGCATAVRSEVSAISKLPADLAAKSFYVAPRKEQQGSLEFEHYAQLVGAELQAHGLKPAPAGQADLVVLLRYALDQQTELVATPTFGPTGSYVGGGTTVMMNGRMVFVPTYSAPMYGFTGTAVLPTIVNRRSLGVDIVSRDSTPEKPDKLYEANVVSEGYSGTLLQVMPAMIKALFTRWPGPAVRTETIDVRLAPARG
ncbi:MAG TPA: DUF4136 domain-containing protein [Burkholderiales bacterium]